LPFSFAMLPAGDKEDGAGYPQMVGSASTVARRSRRLPERQGLSASTPTLPGMMSPGKPPTPGKPVTPGERPRRRNFGNTEACLEAERSPSPALHCSPGKSLPESQSSTPRTPRSVEVRVESQELAVPGAVWASDGQLELLVSANICTVTVKTGLTGRSGVSVVLRVGLALQDVAENCLRFPPTAEALSTWTTVRVSGTEECDIGRLPSRAGSVPKAPHPGSCRHEWDDANSECNGTPNACVEVSAKEALLLGPASVSCDEFYCGLSLDVGATCSVTLLGNAKLRVEVRGELRLLPRFSPAGREGVARLYKAARDSFGAGEDLKALQRCEVAVVMADSLAPRPREMGDVLNLMGAVHLRRKSPSVAVKCLERALLVREQLACGEDDLGMAATLNTLGNAQQALGAHGASLRCHKRACSILKAVLGPSDPAVASCLQSLGGIHRALGSLDDARTSFEEALAIREQVLGADDLLIAATLNNLGAVLQGLTDDRRAIQCYQKALAIHMRVQGRDHPTVAAILSNLGSAHGRLGEHQSALDCHERALSIQERRLGPEDVAVASSLHNLGNALALAGKGSDAARCLWRALAVWSKADAPSQCDIAATLHSLGNVYRGLRDAEAAAKCFAGALRIREKVLGPTHRETARTRHCAALMGCQLGDCSAGLQELEVAASSLLASLGARHPWSMQACTDAQTLRQTIGG